MKGKWVAGAAGLLFPLIVIVCLMGMSGGSAEGGAASPVIVIATEEAYAYQYVGTELGIPWDLTALTDGITAYSAGESSLEHCNPLATALQFCMVREEKYVAREVETGTDAEGLPVTEIQWVLEDTVDFTGRDAILGYVGIGEEALGYADVNGLVNGIYQAALLKSTEEVRYKAVVLAGADYGFVLRDLIGLEEQHIDYLMQLYDVNYMSRLYGYSGRVAGDIELPDIVQGSVTRLELAQVAVSLINHPYLMGGKSSQAGIPSGPLDCSGYVDWVYVQCFGAGVSSGGMLPDGVAVSGTALMWYASEPVEESGLKVGDLGFLYDPAAMAAGKVNHVGIYLGSCGGKAYWIHCGGRYYGSDESPTGRVGISLKSGMNNYNPVDGTTFGPAMKSCQFRYFRRPQFSFLDD